MPVGTARVRPDPGNQGVLPGSSSAAATGTLLFTVGPNLFIDAGSVTAGGTVTGLSPPTVWQIPLVTAKTGASVAIAAAPASGTFGITSGLLTGDHEYLYTETANSSTVTDNVVFEVNYPSGFPSSGLINFTVNCDYVLGAGTIGTHTIATELYTISNAGVLTALTGLVAAIPSSAGDVTFTFAALSPGQILRAVITAVVQDTGGHDVTARINGVRLST